MLKSFDRLKIKGLGEKKERKKDIYGIKKIILLQKNKVS